MKSIRRDNIELLRVIAMLMILTLHALGHGDVLAQYDFGSLGYIFWKVIEALCEVAVNVFVLITGYFMVNSKFEPSRIIKLFLQVECFSIACLAVDKFVFHQTLGLQAFIYTFFPFTSGAYWFVSAYVVLILFVPLLNKLIKSMDKQQHFISIILLTVLFSVIPTFMFWSKDILGNGYNFIWFIVLYFIASYIHLYEIGDRVKSNSFKYLVMYILLSEGGNIINLIIGTVSMLVLGEPRGEALFLDYNSITVFPASVCLFMTFKNMKIENKTLSRISISLGAVCFGVYLVTDNPLLRKPLWKLLNLSRYCGCGIFTLFSIFIVMVILFVVGCCIEWIRVMVFRGIGIEKLYLWIDRRAEKIGIQVHDKISNFLL